MVQALQGISLPVLLICGLIVLLQAARSPRNTALWYFSAVVLLLVVSYAVALVDRDTTSFERLVFNLCGIATVYFEVCFFRTALQRYGRRPVFRNETIVAVAVMAIGVGSWLLAPAELRPDLGQPKNSADLGAFAFQVSIVGYYVVTSARMVVWCVRLFRRLRGHGRPGRRLAEIGFEAGLVVVLVAQATLLVSYGVKLVSAVAVFTDPSRIPAVQAFYAPTARLAGLGSLAFVIGIIVPVLCGAVATVLVALRHRRDHRTLEPLWSAVRAAFPQLPLRSQRGVNGQFYRRGLEVKDSLLLLAPYYDGTVADATTARCRAAGSSPEETSAQVAAALMVDALENKRIGRVIADPHPVPVSGADDWSSDMAWLLRVATVVTATPSTTAADQYG